MLTWCSGDSFDFDGNGPTTCFSYTVIVPIPSIYFLICALNVFKNTSNFIPFDSVDRKTLVFLKILQLLCLLEISLGVIFISINSLSGSLIYATIMQTLSAFVCIFVLEREVWRRPIWPDNNTCIYFGSDLIATIIYTSDGYTTRQSGVNLAVCICLFVVKTGILVFSLYKDSIFRTNEEMQRLELDRFSISKNNGGFVRSHSASNVSSDSSSNYITLSGIVSWLTSPVNKRSGSGSGYEPVGSGGDMSEPLMQGRAHSIASSRRSCSRNGSGSWFSGSGRSPSRDARYIYDSDEDEDEDFDEIDDSEFQNRATVSLLKGLWGGPYYNDSVVKSALDIHLSTDNVELDRTSSTVGDLSAKSSGFGFYGKNLHEVDENGDVVLRPIVSSGILQRAIKQQSRAHSQAGGDVLKSLAPRKLVLTHDGDSGLFMDKSSLNGGSGTSGALGSTSKFDGSYLVSVNNWGLRRERTYSHVPHGNGHGSVGGDEKYKSMDINDNSVRDRSYAMSSGHETGEQEQEASQEHKPGGFTFANFRTRWIGGSSSGESDEESGRSNAVDADANAETVAEERPEDHVEGCDSGESIDVEAEAADVVTVSNDPTIARVESKKIIKATPLARGHKNHYHNAAIGNKLHSDNGVSLDVDCEMMQREFGAGAEIEFEICVRRSGDGSPNDRNKWVIWKTAKELVALHASVLSTLGDAAPRRPKLKTIPEHNRTGNDATTVIPHASIVSDMRNVAAYLTGLLQHQRHLKCPELYHFLEFQDSPNVNLSTVAGSVVPVNSAASLAADMDSDMVGAMEANEESAFQCNNRNSEMELDNIAVAIPNSLVPDSNLQGLGSPSRDTSGISAMESVNTGAVQNQQDQERWRRLFVNMRVHLKPTAIAIRCRLYEGVITGADICKWLVQCQYKFAQDSAEACIIGQELVGCGLLIPVCCGYEDFGYDDDEEEYDIESRGSDHCSDCVEDSVKSRNSSRRRLNTGGSESEALAPVFIPPGSPVAMTFSTADGFLYRYPSKSHTSEGVGSFTLLGAMITVEVKRWAKRDDMEGGKKNKEVAETNAFGFAIADYGGVEKQLEANTEGQGYIHYELVVRHHNDEWALWKRYRDFEQYNKLLYKYGIKPSMSLPSKRFMSAVSTFGQSVHTQIETRRASLEAFMISAVEAVMVAVSSSASTPLVNNAKLALVLTVEFLDPDYNNLLMVEQPLYNRSPTRSFDQTEVDSGAV